MSVLADNMIVYIGSLTDHVINKRTNKQTNIELINKYSKVVGYTVNIQKSIAFCNLAMNIC